MNGPVRQGDLTACGFRTSIALIVSALLAILGLLVPGAAVAQDPPAGAISGNVTDVNGAPLADVCVDADSFDPGSQGSYGFAQTDVDGNYEVGGLEGGNYRVRFSDCGQGNLISEYHNDTTDYSSAEPVGVTEGQTTPGIDASLREGGRISGTVTDASDNALADVCVSAQAFNPGPGGTYGSDQTDVDGNYELSGLETGNYRVSFSGCGQDSNLISEYYNDTTDYSSAQPVAVTEGQTTPGIHASLREGGRISGTVTDANGAPLANVCVDTDSFGSQGSYGFDQTDIDGNYEIGGLAGGDYRVRFSDCGQGNLISEYYNDTTDYSSAQPVAVTEGQTTPGIHASLREGGRISGTVTDASGNALANVCVDADSQGTNGSDQTDIDGNYEIGGLAGGDYRVRFSDCGQGNLISEYYNDTTDYSSAQPVAVTEGQTTPGIHASLREGGRISGTVTDASGNALANVCVGAQAFNPGPGGTNGSDQTDIDGNYEIGGLAGGDYRVSFSDCGQGNLISEYYNDTTDYSSAQPVAVTEGQTTPGIHASLREGGRISGTVTDASDNALANVCVTAQPFNPGPGGTSGFDQTDVDGNYEIGGLLGGDYRVRFGGCGGGQGGGDRVTEYYNDKPTFNSADPVPVTEGETTPGVNASLREGGRISGHVTDSAGDPLAGVCVFASSGGQYGEGGAYSSTASDGSYTLQGLATGSYKVGFGPCGGGGNQNLVREYYNDKPTLATADPVNVVEGQTTPGIDASLREGGRISGHISGPAGEPLLYICVTAVSPSVGDARDVPDAIVAQVGSGNDGNYLLQGLPGGSYKLHFTDCGGFSRPGTDYAQEAYNDKPRLSLADPVLVTEGQTTDAINAQLQEGGRISGTVTDGTQPLSGVCVAALDPGSGEGVALTRTTFDGSYALAGLAPGSYKVEFFTADCSLASAEGQETEYYQDQANLATATTVAVAAGENTGGIDATLAADTSAPETEIDSGPAGSSNLTTADFAFSSSEANSGFECKLDTGAWESCDSPKTYPGLSEGAHTFEVRATDQANNTDATPASRTWTIATASNSQTTAGSADADETVSSDPDGSGADSTDPVLTSVTTPVAGDVTITESDTTTQTPPSGYAIFGQEVLISAPDATVADPLTLVFVLDASVIPSGTTLSSVSVFRNGQPAGNCDTSGDAIPNPCIAQRRLLTGGDYELTVLTSQASPWNFGHTAYAFQGFYSPIAAPPALNRAQAGSGVSLRFSLGGDQGLGVLASGYPRSHKISCDPAATDQGDDVQTAGSLSYDSKSTRYTYAWKTSKTWASKTASSCRQFVLRLNDGSLHPANFRFSK